jgi:signal transduction histidine kinase
MNPIAPYSAHVFSMAFALFGIFFLFPKNSNGETSTHILPFEVFADKGQSVTEAWEYAPEEYITTGKFNPGIQLNRWWVKTIVKNDSEIEDKFFLILNNPHINYIEVYMEGSAKASFISGDHFPFDSRPYPNRDFVFPFDLKSGESKKVLMILDKRGETFHIEPLVVNENKFNERRINEYLIMGIVTGWMALIIVFTLFLWSELKHRSAFYYTIFILSVFLWIFSNWGMGFQYLWPESVTWVGKSRPVFNLATNVALLLTIINFFPPTLTQQPWKFIFRGLIWINGLLLIAFLIIPENNVNPEIIAFFLKVMLAFSAIQLLSIVSYLINKYLAKIQFAGYYLAGISFLYCFSTLVYLDQIFGSVQLSHYLLNFGSAFGTMGETGLIAFAFMRQASREKKEKEILALKILKKEKDVADQIILAQEEERNRLGRDLHDGLLSFLGNVHLKLQSILENNHDPKLIEVKNQIFEGIRETRVLSHDLTPPFLEELGLEKALENQLLGIQQSGTIKITLFTLLESAISQSIQVTIYRICIELINNVIKHSGAHELHVALTNTQKEIQLMVEDDGVGFDTQLAVNGIGLKNIQNRVQYLKGTLQIDSNTSGTSILVLIPIQSNPNE